MLRWHGSELSDARRIRLRENLRQVGKCVFTSQQFHISLASEINVSKATLFSTLELHVNGAKLSEQKTYSTFDRYHDTLQSGANPQPTLSALYEIYQVSCIQFHHFPGKNGDNEKPILAAIHKSIVRSYRKPNLRWYITIISPPKINDVPTNYQFLRLE